jgi:segregation and condensation protein A
MIFLSPRITKEFMELSSHARTARSEVAGDFILMACNSDANKVKMLLPKEVDEKGDEI